MAPLNPLTRWIRFNGGCEFAYPHCTVLPCLGAYKTTAGSSKSEYNRKLWQVRTWQWLIKWDKCTLTKVRMMVGFLKLTERQPVIREEETNWEITECNILSSVISLTGIWCLDVELNYQCFDRTALGWLWKMYPSKIADDLWNDTIKWLQQVETRKVEMKGRDYMWTSACTVSA